MSCELETVWESTETNLSPYIHSDTETALLGQSLSSEILNVERVPCDIIPINMANVKICSKRIKAMADGGED